MKKQILKLMTAYRKRQGVGGIELVIQDDGSGSVQTWGEAVTLFMFDNEAGLREGLKK